MKQLILVLTILGLMFYSCGETPNPVGTETEPEAGILLKARTQEIRIEGEHLAGTRIGTWRPINSRTDDLYLWFDDLNFKEKEHDFFLDSEGVNHKDLHDGVFRLDKTEKLGKGVYSALLEFAYRQNDNSYFLYVYNGEWTQEKGESTIVFNNNDEAPKIMKDDDPEKVVWSKPLSFTVDLIGR